MGKFTDMVNASKNPTRHPDQGPNVSIKGNLLFSEATMPAEIAKQANASVNSVGHIR